MPILHTIDQPQIAYSFDLTTMNEWPDLAIAEIQIEEVKR